MLHPLIQTLLPWILFNLINQCIIRSHPRIEANNQAGILPVHIIEGGIAMHSQWSKEEGRSLVVTSPRRTLMKPWSLARIEK